MDKTGRNGLRAGDIASPDFREKYRFLSAKHAQILKLYAYPYNLADHEPEWLAGIEKMKSFTPTSGVKDFLYNERNKRKNDTPFFLETCCVVFLYLITLPRRNVGVYFFDFQITKQNAF